MPSKHTRSLLEVDEYQDAHLEIFGIWLQPVCDRSVVAKSIQSDLSVVFFSGVIRDFESPLLTDVSKYLKCGVWQRLKDVC